jgi:hypothetical protein
MDVTEIKASEKSKEFGKDFINDLKNGKLKIDVIKNVGSNFTERQSEIALSFRTYLQSEKAQLRMRGE